MKNLISQSDAPATEEKVLRKHQRDTASVTYYLSSSTGESGLTGETRVNVMPEKRIPKKKKYIKPKALFAFIPGNKIILYEDNDNNPETTDTLLTGKYDITHTGSDYFTGKKMKKVTNNDDEYREETWKVQEGYESVDNSETSETLRDDSIIKTTKKEKN